jgi:AdoMet-dependent rRNA methyltransferase SPB1
VAKEQGLRSRAAFKLTQINRKFPVLEKCTNSILDLCAAPGGWTQIAARTCPKNVQIVAVDILPIRKVGPNVTTLIGDITTEKCKAEITRTLQQGSGGECDLVLHDGAPNVGAEYGKDAYEQNELSLHALKCATQHLKKGGTFITKIYRSRDYAAYLWVLQQLFEITLPFKPKASRAASAEIFLVAQNYKAPAKLDPRFLDPKHVFQYVEGETTGGEMGSHTVGFNVFHKNFDKKVRKRGGYDMEHLDATMRHVESVEGFCQVGLKDAIDLLSTSTGLTFNCQECRQEDIKTVDKVPGCSCKFLVNHPLTTSEIKEYLGDLRVLNKSDFKGLITWRTKMQAAMKARREQQIEDGDEKAESSDEEEEVVSDQDSDKEEIEIQKEIEEMRGRRALEKRRVKKKERAVAAKRRRQAALGMDLNAIDIPEHDKIFSLTAITSKGDLEAAHEVNLDRVTDEQLFGDSDDDVVIGKDSDSESDEETDRLARRERELDDAYGMYLQNSNVSKTGTKTAKRSKKYQRLKVAQEATEDQDMMLSTPAGIGDDTRAYVKLLQGPRDSDDESSDDEEDDDGFHADPMTPGEHVKLQKRQKKEEGNPLIHKFAEEPTSAKTARWFSNPLFESIGQAAQSAVGKKKKTEESDDDVEADSGVDSSDGSEDDGPRKKKKVGLTADEIFASIPKTEKVLRHERRLKQIARDERKIKQRARKSGETEAELELAPAEENLAESLSHLSESQRKKVMEARDLIKAGLGKATDEGEDSNSGIQVVPRSDIDRPLPLRDSRKYDSDHEDYDSDDYAETLALGTMMLRKSKQKALVDASYNRFAWNDPEDLPEWFVDDETRNYRPQLPIPEALVAKMKEKMMVLSAKPIAKVAEARARKSKRAKAKLQSAKKQAEAVANSSEMSEAMKLKAISKALRGQDSKNAEKSYVVSKKGRGIKGGKGIALVDKRLKSDKRSMKRTDKKRKSGKQGGMVGSKKRRGTHK